MNEKYVSTIDSKPDEEKEHWKLGRQKFLDQSEWGITSALQSAASSNSHLMMLLEAVENKDSVDLVYENYKESEDLGTWIRENKGGIDKNLLISIVIVVIDAVINLHKKDIVHRDINPSNYLITDPNNIAESIKLGDFETAQFATKPNNDFQMPVGTPEYTSTDQRVLEKKVDRKMDQFSLAITLIFLLTGGTFEPTEDHEDTVTKGCNEIISQYGEQGREIAAIIKRAANPFPDQRFSNVTEFKQALVKTLGN